MIKVKSSPPAARKRHSKRLIYATLLGASFLISSTGAALAASLPDAEAGPSIGRSADGALLAAIVAMHRHNVPMADQAAYDAVQAGVTSADFIGLAEHYAAMDEGDTAAGRAADLAEKLPLDRLSHLILGDSAIRQSHWKDAEALFNDPHAKGLVGILNPIQKAWALVGAGQPREALKELTHVAPDNPVGPLIVMQAARIAVSINHADAASLLKKLANARLSAPPVLDYLIVRTIADAEAAQGDAKAAAKTIDTLGTQNPAFLPVAARMAPDKARAMTLDPRKALADAYAGLGAVMIAIAPSDHKDETQVTQSVVTVLRQALWLDPGNVAARVVLSEALRMEKQFGPASDVLKAIPASAPLASVADRSGAALAVDAEDWPLALERLQRLKAETPDDVGVLEQLGEVQAQLGDNAAAVKAFGGALAHTNAPPTSRWPLWLSRAIALDHLGRHAEAQKDLDQALAASPDEPMLLNYIGYSSIERGDDPAKALALLKHATEIDPKSAEIRDSYAWALLKAKGDIDAALPLLTQSVEAQPNDAEITYHLGVAYWYLGRHVEARDQWNQALGDDPDAATRALLDKALADGPNLPVFSHQKRNAVR